MVKELTDRYKNDELEERILKEMEEKVEFGCWFIFCNIDYLIP